MATELPDPEIERTISVERAAELLGASKRTIYAAVRNGPSQRPTSCRLIKGSPTTT